MEKQSQLKKSQQQQQMFQIHQSQPATEPTSPSTAYAVSPVISAKQAKKQEKLMKKSTSPTLKRKSSLGLYKDVARDNNGMPKFPLVLGELCIESLGTIIARPPFITDKHVWPVGFSSTRYFSSMINPEIRVKYTSQIIDVADKPQFIVTAADDPINPIVSHSPSGAWRTVLKRVMAKNGNSDDRSKNVSVSGTLRFGLAHPVVSSMLQDMPGADKCKEYMLACQQASGASSPGKKRKNSGSASDESSSDEFAAEWLSAGSKSPRFSMQPSSPGHSSGDEDLSVEVPDIPMTREEAEDLESAVSVLQALKYCTVY